MNFPELPEYPTDAKQILNPITESGRPLVWDEDGVPLNSDVPGPRLRPNRDVRDYTEAPHLVTWPESMGRKWSNTALMRHMEGAIPDMLALTIETTQGLREMFGKDGLFTYQEGLLAVEGLQKAWSLLMYGPRRLPNGQLPRHFAGMQRALLGHQGTALMMAFDSPLLLLMGHMNDGEIDPEKFADIVFDPESDNLRNSGTNEICPASKAAHIALIDCLFAPKDEAVSKHGEKWLDAADPSRNLASYGLAPDMLLGLGTEASQMLLDPMNQDNAHNLLMMHRYLVGDTSPEVETHMFKQAFSAESY